VDAGTTLFDDPSIVCVLGACRRYCILLRACGQRYQQPLGTSVSCSIMLASWRDRTAAT